MAAAPAKEDSSSFPSGSAVCRDSLTDSNPLNITTTTLSNDGKNLSVVINLDSPYPAHGGRAFRIVMGAARQQEDYVATIEETTDGGVTTSVTDSRTESTIQLPAAVASITDQKVSAEIPTANFPRMGSHFTWKVEALSGGRPVDICPDEDASGIRVWLDFPQS